MGIGNKLRGCRVEKGLSTVQIADILNVSESTYRRYETEKSFPNLPMLCKLAETFEKPVTDLLTDSLYQQNNNNEAELIYRTAVTNLSRIIEQYETHLREKDEIIQQLKDKISSQF